MESLNIDRHAGSSLIPFSGNAATADVSVAYVTAVASR